MSDSTAGSQLASLDERRKVRTLDENYGFKNLVDEPTLKAHLARYSKYLKKMDPSERIRASLGEIEKLNADTGDSRALKDIYRHILQQHTYRTHMFTDAYIDACSEMSIITKYWSDEINKVQCQNNDDRALKDIYRYVVQQHAFKGHMFTDAYVHTEKGGLEGSTAVVDCLRTGYQHLCLVHNYYLGLGIDYRYSWPAPAEKVIMGFRQLDAVITLLEESGGE
ncbi:uncharacterized protein BYT42DRAFT_612712 [Radiomyces spectabilis]|uniref:uncharacterized protein n=1 Tax=Radiomyces spectabilis TaxID=64574 RepID=UPI00221E4092|nr:uncharacterized protein BYT42DRAFT_612712 [Radiomyces spectabilis]KAI8380878.1 hypothetical protein BYT42DRAFT_612712 [Radiomyces spectabilis]